MWKVTVVNEKPLDEMQELKKQVAYLTEMLKSVSDINAVNKFERSKEKKSNPKYSIWLWNWEIILSWKMTRNFVAEWWKQEDQKIKLFLAWGEEREVSFIEFSRMLQVTNKLEAKHIIPLEDEEGEYNEIEYEGQTYKIYLKFLNP